MALCFLDQVRSGLALDEFDADDFASPRLDFRTSDDFIDRPVGTFCQNVGLEFENQFEGVVLGKDDDMVHAGESGQHLRASLLILKGAGIALEAPDAAVRVQSDDELVSQSPGHGEIANMSRVQKIKTTVGEDYAVGLPAVGLAGALGRFA